MCLLYDILIISEIKILYLYAFHSDFKVNYA